MVGGAWTRVPAKQTGWGTLARLSALEFLWKSHSPKAVCVKLSPNNSQVWYLSWSGWRVHRSQKNTAKSQKKKWFNSNFLYFSFILIKYMFPNRLMSYPSPIHLFKHWPKSFLNLQACMHGPDLWRSKGLKSNQQCRPQLGTSLLPGKVLEKPWN